MRNLKEYPITFSEIHKFIVEQKQHEFTSGTVGGMHGAYFSYLEEFLTNNAEFDNFIQSKMDVSSVVVREVSEPRLYIIMRNDLDSLNPGKAVAQGSHAANAMVRDVRRYGTIEQKRMLDLWESQTSQSFGTCIVLSSNIRDIERRIDDAVIAGVCAGMTHDPTYPVEDGEVCHLIPLNTCGYIFGTVDETAPFRNGLKLMD